MIMMTLPISISHLFISSRLAIDRDMSYRPICLSTSLRRQVGEVVNKPHTWEIITYCESINYAWLHALSRRGRNSYRSAAVAAAHQAYRPAASWLHREHKVFEKKTKYFVHDWNKYVPTTTMCGKLSSRRNVQQNLKKSAPIQLAPELTNCSLGCPLPVLKY